MKLNSIYLSVLLFIFMLASCGKDEPTVIKELVASFEVEKIEDLTVTLKNTSKESKSYEWNFGDGKTSTDKNPTHTYESSGSYKVTLKASNENTSKSVSKDVVVADKYKKKGYILSSVATSSAASTYYAGYFSELPSGDIDMTSKQSFQRVLFKAVHNGYIYGRTSTNSSGLAKFAVDGKTGVLETVAELPLLDFPGDVTIISEELGFLSFFANTAIVVFNPMTMKKIGEVDMTGAKAFPASNNRNGYNSIIHNPKTGKIYATSYTNNSDTPVFYDASEVWIEVIDVATRKREKTSVQADAQFPLFRGNINTVIDEAGNTYLICQGSYGIDQQIGPTAAKGSRPQILRINTNSEFDKDYAFNPINKVGFQNNFFQLLTSLVYMGDNKAVAIGSSQVDAPEIVALLQKLGQGTITSAEYDQLVYLVLYTESMSMMEIDLNTKESKVIDNTKTAGFAYPFMYNYDGNIFGQITGANGTYNGFYKYSPSTNTASPQFNITSGGLATHFIDISKNF